MGNLSQLHFLRGTAKLKNMKTSNFSYCYRGTETGMGVACSMVNTAPHARCVQCVVVALWSNAVSTDRYAANGHQDGARSNGPEALDHASSLASITGKEVSREASSTEEMTTES